MRPRQDGSGFLAAPRLSSRAVPMDGNQSRPGPEETGGGRRREGETAAGSTLNFNSRVPCGRLNLGGQRPAGRPATPQPRKKEGSGDRPLVPIDCQRDSQTGVAPGGTRGRKVRSKCR